VEEDAIIPTQSLTIPLLTTTTMTTIQLPITVDAVVAVTTPTTKNG
jgi:hypothetical protein